MKHASKPIKNLLSAIFAIITISLASLAVSQASEEKAYSRVVAIGGSVTEIIYALGEQERLIARDLTSMYPHEAMKLPSVGYIRRLSPEGVLSVQPDLIITLEGAGPREAMDALTAANVPISIVPEGYSSQKVIEKIIAVGKALGVEDKAAALVEKVKSEFAALALKSDENAKKVIYVHSFVGDKILVAGANTSAGSIIELAGGKNGFNEINGFKQVSEEAVISAQPDVILMMQPFGNHSISSDDVFAHPAVKVTPAGQNKALVRMNGLYLLGFGPRTASAVKDLNSKLYE